MYWIVTYWDIEEDESYTTRAESFYEAFGFFTSAVMHDNCARCEVQAYNNGGHPIGNPVLQYDNTMP